MYPVIDRRSLYQLQRLGLQLLQMGILWTMHSIPVHQDFVHAVVNKTY